MKRLPSQVRMLPIFQDLDDAAFDELSRNSVFRSLVRGDTLCNKGDPSLGLFVLMRGQLKVFDVSIEGREVGLQLIKGVTVFGELGVIDNVPRSADITALTESDVAVIPKGTLMKVFTESPNAAFGMFKHLTAMVRRLSQHHNVLSMPSANQRICAVLIEMAGKNSVDGPITLEVPRQKELASMANTSRETVSRTLGQLIADGVLVKTSRRMTVQRLGELKQIAGLD
jgi:CRP/FNR family transcriptional regulator, cyclic AMP receptor protein